MRAMFFSIVLFIVLVSSVVISRKHRRSKSIQETLNWKYQKLTELSDEHDLIQDLRIKLFVKLFVDEPRNYSGFLLFNTQRPNCPECESAQRSLGYLSNSYKKSISLSNNKMKRRTFFLEVQVENEPGILRMVGVGSSDLPALFYFPENGTLEDLTDVSLGGNEGERAPEAISEWIASVSGISITIGPDSMQHDHDLSESEPFVMKYIAIALLLTHLYKHRTLILGLLLYETSTVVGICTIVVVCFFTSGNIFNTINDVPFIGQSTSGLHFIQYQTNSQFGAETFFIFILYCCVTASTILLIEIRKLDRSNWNAAIGMGALVGALTCFNIIHKVYSSKMDEH